MSMTQEAVRIARNLRTRTLGVHRAKKALMAVPPLECDTKNLRPADQLELSKLLNSPESEKGWEASARHMASLAIPEATSGGVNPGDRRAIYYLVSGLAPASVLEIGTHVGASTTQIASALHASRVQRGASARLVSVDIHDVNCPDTQPWLAHGTNQSPREMIEALGHADFVDFVAKPSLTFLAGSEERFDFIFLDGDHSAKTVYEEIPAALARLNPNGVILLHDYFPKLKPLWSNGSVIPGPFLANERLAREGANLVVLPLGALPWPTKLQSNVTSLALLLRNE
ncbi:MAG: class I SAM-dependent methyltransferase [Candidatus Hydrogenedentota bacterium]